MPNRETCSGRGPGRGTPRKVALGVELVRVRQQADRIMWAKTRVGEGSGCSRAQEGRESVPGTWRGKGLRKSIRRSHGGGRACIQGLVGQCWGVLGRE